MRTAVQEMGATGLGTGLGIASSVVARVILPSPLPRLVLTILSVYGTFKLAPTPFRYALQGSLIASGAVDLLHLRSRIQYADAPRGGIGALEAELARATPWDAGHAVAAPRLRDPALAALR